MRKKIINGIAVGAVIAIAMFNLSLSMWDSSAKMSVLSLISLDALASGEESGIKVYANSTSACPSPKEYKTSRSCPSGSELEYCSVSDC